MGMKVAVLMGGTSFERAFSLESGKNVCDALEEAGHRVVPLDTNSELVPTLRSEKPDVVYNALHGKHGEDGTIQSLLEFLGIPFVGSPASVCHRSWNKARCTPRLRSTGTSRVSPRVWHRGPRACTSRATRSKTWARRRRSTSSRSA